MATETPSEWKHYPSTPKPPSGAPNVLLILTDDVGFGATSTFGGPIPTPTFDALAANGLRYNQFYTTAMCSPTRAALLTGRNHHAVGYGAIANVSTDDEGYTSVIPKSAATIGRVLRDSGYDTAWLGKNHNTPLWEAGPLGPFDRWPNGLGFDYFYGFHGAATDQFHPSLVENRNVAKPDTGKDYHLDKDCADRLIHWLRMQHTVKPDHPFFAYWAPGTLHSPHQAPREWIDRFKGQFDQGWDKLREQTFERQKQIGVIPEDAALTPRMEGLPAWESLGADYRRVYARMMEAAAAQLSHCDHHIGRVVEHLRATGQLGNTLIIFVQGDNGASLESPYGATNELRSLYGLEHSIEELTRDFDEIGGPNAYGNYPSAWGWATNTPFPWGKQVASHLGGLCDGLVISWPRRIKDVGKIRSQFSHVIDIAPTIYEAAGIAPPDAVDGVPQQPIDGVSMVHTFDEPNAPARHREQYFEMVGNRSYYKDGWLASTKPARPPWDRLSPPADPESLSWELYDLNTDWSQAHDISNRHPEKLAELQAAFDQAARKYSVYPLMSGLLPRLGPHLRPSLLGTSESYVYHAGPTFYSGGSMPALRPGWRMSAKIEIKGSTPEGTILVQGDLFGGQALYLDQGRATFLYNPLGGANHVTRLTSDMLVPGAHLIAVEVTGETSSARISLSVDGKIFASATLSPYRASRGGAYVGSRGTSPFLPDFWLPEPRGLKVEYLAIEASGADR